MQIILQLGSIAVPFAIGITINHAKYHSKAQPVDRQFQKKVRLTLFLESCTPRHIRRGDSDIRVNNRYHIFGGEYSQSSSTLIILSIL